MENKYVLILGGTSDIGLALAHQYAKAGYYIYLASRRVERLEKDAADIRIRYQVEVILLEFDALKFDLHASFCEALNPFPVISICVFGFLTDQLEAERDWNAARLMIDTNFTGATSILHHLANGAEEQGEGTLVGISSVAGDRGRASNYYYGSAKAGFSAFLSGLRNRLVKKNIHVLTVKPGYVRTKMTAALVLPGLLTANPEKTAEDIFYAVKRKRNVLYTKWMWRYIMLIIRNIPEFIFKRLGL